MKVRPVDLPHFKPDLVQSKVLVSRQWLDAGAVSYIFSFRAALGAEKVRGPANYNSEKGHHSSKDREGSWVHPGSGDRCKTLRPNGCVTQGVVRRRAPGRDRCPRSKTTQNSQSVSVRFQPCVLRVSE